MDMCLPEHVLGQQVQIPIEGKNKIVLCICLHCLDHDHTNKKTSYRLSTQITTPLFTLVLQIWTCCSSMPHFTYTPVLQKHCVAAHVAHTDTEDISRIKIVGCTKRIFEYAQIVNFLTSISNHGVDPVCAYRWDRQECISCRHHLHPALLIKSKQPCRSS